jgi:hypothetical protein
MFIWRKGEKWRREYRFPLARTPEERRAFKELKFPPAGPEAAAWWREMTKGWRVNPIEICDGRAVYGDTSKTEKTEWKKVHSGPDLLGSYRSYLPEIQGYPDLLGPSPSVSIELDAHPKEGPPGTVLLIARPTAQKAAPGDGRIFRYWIDPAKSYIVMRHERTDSDPEPGKPKSLERYVVDRVAQAPNGVWYPIVVRREYLSGVQGKEKRGEETWTFSIDFQTEIPDDLFKVESSQ